MSACARSGCGRTEGLTEVRGYVFCRSHLRTAHYDAYGRCDFKDANGSRCRSHRFTRRGGLYASLPGFCRQHEGSYFTSVDAQVLSNALDRFGAQLAPDWRTGCWHWTGGPAEGRGQFQFNKMRFLPYRFSYGVFFGGHRNGFELSHLCDAGGPTDGRGTCANPLHVAPSTHRANVNYSFDQRVLNRHVEGHGDSDAAAWAVLNNLPVGLHREKYLDVKIYRTRAPESVGCELLSA